MSFVRHMRRSRRTCAAIVAVTACVCAASSSVAAAATDYLQPPTYSLLNEQPAWIETSGPIGLGIAGAWQYTRGNGVTVGVIDSGADPDLPDLSGQITGGSDFLTPLQDVDDPAGTDTSDLEGHGSMTSGIIAAHPDASGNGMAGVAPDAKLIELRVLDADGIGQNDAIVSAMDSAGAASIPVVNMSLGGFGLDGPAESQAVAEHPGTLYVAAAGNAGTDDDSAPFYPCAIPAPNLICVGAVDVNGARAIFPQAGESSNWGANTVAVFAPGLDVLVPFVPQPSQPEVTSHGMGWGTSMAAPIVSGEAALLLSLDPALTAAQTKTIIMQNVIADPALAGDAQTSGVVNVLAAVNAVRSMTAPQPVTAPPAAAATPRVRIVRLASRVLACHARTCATRRVTVTVTVSGRASVRVTAYRLPCEFGNVCAIAQTRSAGDDLQGAASATLTLGPGRYVIRASASPPDASSSQEDRTLVVGRS